MNSIETSYVALFREGFEQAFQQTESKLQPFFESETQNSEYQYFDRIGTAEAMQDNDTRLGNNPTSEIIHDRRRVGLKDYELGKYVDEKDLKRVLTDPMNAYTQAMLASGNRKIDDIIIDKFFGTADTGKTGGTAKNFVGHGGTTDSDGTNSGIAAASNKINFGADTTADGAIATGGDYLVDTTANTEGLCIGGSYGAATSGLTLAKLRAARTAMLKLFAIDQDDVINCFVSAQQIDDLLGITEVVSSDFAVRKALVEGSVTTFLGFRFIQTERLPKVGDERRCIIAAPKALKLSIGEGLKGDMWRDPSKKNAPYLYYKLCADAVRMWGEVSGEIRCTE